MKAFNVYKTGNKNANNLICKIGSSSGYSLGAQGSYTGNSSNEYRTGDNSIEAGLNNVFMTAGSHYWRLAFPSSHHRLFMVFVYGLQASVYYDSFASSSSSTFGICPIVPLDL